MKVLVTGARGHVGRHLVTRLVHAGHQVSAHIRRGDTPPWTTAPERISTGDLSNAQTARDAIGDADAVVHCAARVRDGKPGDFMSDNVLATQHLAQTALDRALRFVHLSTVAVYGKKAHEQGTENVPFAPGDDPYARSKVAAEEMLAGLSDLSLIVLRAGVIWGGPHDPRLMPSLVRRLKTRSLVLPGRCDNPIPFTHVDNLGDAILLALVRPDVGGEYNITDAAGVSMRAFATALARNLDLPGPLFHIPEPVVQLGFGLLEALRARIAPHRPMPLRRDTVALLNSGSTFSVEAARRELGYAPQLREHLQSGGTSTDPA